MLVAVDDAALRHELIETIDDAPELILADATAEARPAVTMVSALKPQVVLLGLFNYKRAIGDLVREMIMRSPAACVIVLGREADHPPALELVRDGVRGVLGSDRATTDLRKVVRCVIAGQYWMNRGVIGEIVRALNRKDACPPADEVMSALFSLTPTEQAIVDLVAAGHSNEDIARQRGVTPGTVKHHLTSIFHKTGAGSRVELALLAVARRSSAATVAPLAHQ